MKRFFLAGIFLLGMALCILELVHEGRVPCHLERWKWLAGVGMMIVAAWADQVGFERVVTVVSDRFPVFARGGPPRSTDTVIAVSGPDAPKTAAEAEEAGLIQLRREEKP